MELTVKITPRVAAGVARRLKLAASVRSRSMSAMVNDALDQALPSLEEIRMQLAAPAGGAEAGWSGDLAADGHPGPVHAAAGRGDEPGRHGYGGRGGDDRGRP
jgi:plasmid stability protein